jgi:hypothetical protein
MARPKGLKPNERPVVLARLSQSEFAMLIGHDARVLIDWESVGMPRNSDGTYDAPAIIRWLKEQDRSFWRKSMGSGTGSGGIDPQDYEELDKKYKALLRKKKFEEADGQLIPLSDAQRKYIGVILQIRAALLAQSEILAPQLANLEPRDIARLIDKRLRWICDQLNAGWVPVPEDMVRTIDAMLAPAGAP